MKNTSKLFVFTGFCFIATGLRNLFLPGFLSISSFASGDGAVDIALGCVFLLIARSRSIELRKNKMVG